MAKIVSDLDLHGQTPLRTRPDLAERAPAGVPSTRAKRIQRILVPIAFAGAMLALAIAWYAFFVIINGTWGFGLGPVRR